MKYVSVRKNGISLFLCLMFSVLAFASLGLSMGGVWIKSIWQLSAMICAVVAIQIAQKHLLSSYEYILDPSDELLTHNRLTVIRTVGKNRSSLYTVPLSSLTSVIPYKKMRKVEKEYGKIGKKFSFCSDIHPKESCLLIFEDSDELTIIRLQCDEAFMNALSDRRGI